MTSKPSSKSTNSTKPNKFNNNVCGNVLSKLRRLKIEENLLVQSLQKLDRKRDNEVVKVVELEISFDVDYKNMLKNLRDSYINMKTLFEDVKTMTYSQELLADVELDEIKKKILELETTLKSFKGYVNAELNSLKNVEQELMKQLEEMNCNETNSNKKQTKISSVNYSQVVPSPVRLLMTSPFKCTEVQEFQDFMRNSPNRYGGWNEYHHSIFVKYWNKHFGNTTDMDYIDPLVETLAFENFIEEASFKLQGVGRENLVSHIDWYKKYLFYKDKQQKAIDKWKSNRRSIMKAPRKVNNSEELSHWNRQNKSMITGDNDSYGFDEIACPPKEERRYPSYNSKKSQCLEMKKKSIKKAKPQKKIIGQDDIERFMKPTKQWLNRNYDEEHSTQQIHFVDNMEKLCIPTWRKYL